MLSRVWYLVLALTAGAALAGAFLNKSAASREAEFQLEEQLRRDRIEAELWMRLDARLRLDALASIAVEPEVRQTLRSSSNRIGTPSSATRRRLSIKLNALNAKLEEGRGDLVFAVDNEGEVVATLDKNTTSNEYLGGMPLVRDALRGFMRDDVWVYNDEVYRMAARPVFDGGRYVGAIVHGMRIGDDLAKRLGAKLPNASIVFFYRDRLIAAHSGGASALTSSELKAELPTVLASLGADNDSIAVAERARAIASPIRGGAAHAEVGYMIGRKGSSVGLGGLFANTFKEDVASLPWHVVVGVPLVLLLLGIALLYLEHDKPVVILRKSAEALARKQGKSLPEGELRRHYRKIAEHINVALRSGVGFQEDAEQRAGVDLDHILDKTRQSADTGYFGFSTGEAPTAKRSAVPDEEDAGRLTPHVAPIDEPADPPAKVSTAAETPGTQTADSADSKESPKDASPARPDVATTARPKRAPSSRPKRASSWPSRAPSSRHPAAAAVRPSEETPAPDDPPTRPNALLEDYDGFDDPEESTQIKHVPQSLLEASAPGVQGEETHFREVFDQFVATQKECGVPVSGLTFDKFVRKLHAARDQVIKRHNAAEVRFTVYVKEGRAALKASPVKQ